METIAFNITGHVREKWDGQAAMWHCDQREVFLSSFCDFFVHFSGMLLQLCVLFAIISRVLAQSHVAFDRATASSLYLS